MGANGRDSMTAATVSSVNQTTTPLGSGATFTGSFERNDSPDVMVSCVTDNTGTLYFDFSIDGTNVNSFPSAGFKLSSGVHAFHNAVKGPRYFRARLVNDSGSQSYLRLATYFGNFRQLNSPLNQSIAQDADATTVRALTEEVAISQDLLTGYSIVNKFGTNGDIDTGSVPEDIWDGGGAYTGFPDSTLETVSVFSDNAADASGMNGARTITIIGLDANYAAQSETITLNGVTPVASANQYRRLHTASIASAGSGGVNAGTITVRHTTTTANVFLVMVPGRNQTNCAVYTVPAGYTAYMRYIHAAVRGGATASLDGQIWTRSFGSPFRSRRPFTVGSSTRLGDYIYGGLRFTEKSDLTLRITSSSANNVSISGGFDLILVKN